MLSTQTLQLPEGLICQLNCEVYYKGEYLGRVQDMFSWLDNPMMPQGFPMKEPRYEVMAKGEAVVGKADTKEAGLYILYLHWVNQQTEKLEVSDRQKLIGE